MFPGPAPPPPSPSGLLRRHGRPREHGDQDQDVGQEEPEVGGGQEEDDDDAAAKQQRGKQLFLGYEKILFLLFCPRLFTGTHKKETVILLDIS